MATTTAQDIPRTIRASIHQDAISRVPDFFNASFKDILNELFQNARRSGAANVDVNIIEDRVSVSDDGQGIADPQVLLDFGRSGWDSQSALNERPAGMGLYSLGRKDGVSIMSKTRGLPEWAVTLNSANFAGLEPARVEIVPSRVNTGVTVAFCVPNAIAHTKTVEECARYFPLPVTLNGETLEKWEFLQNAVRVEEWRGLRIGVHRGNNSYDNRLNFHGIPAPLAQDPIRTKQDNWYAKVDVVDCPDLHLTLPARKELVQTDFVDEMLQECRAAIYRAIKDSPTPVDLPKRVRDEAASMGIQLPEAQPLLKNWVPQAADIDSDSNHPPTSAREAGPDTLVIDLEDTCPADQIALARAAEISGMDQRLAEHDPDMEGYGWYDSLTHITEMSVTITDEDGTHDIQELRGKKITPSTQRPDRIQITLHGHNQQEEFTVSMDTDLAFEEEEETFSCNRQLVTKSSGLSAQELANMIHDAYFIFSEDPEADSYDTQKEYHEEESLKTATALLHSPEEAALSAVAGALDRHVLWEVPAGMEATITLRKGSLTREPLVKVELTPITDEEDEVKEDEG